MRNEPAGHHANVMTTSAGSLSSTFSPASRRLRKLLHGVLIEVYKLSQIHGEGSVFVLAEWVHAQHGFQAGHNNGERQRVQARVHQRQFIGQRPEPLVLLMRDLLELVENLRSNAHARVLRWQCSWLAWHAYFLARRFRRQAVPLLAGQSARSECEEGLLPRRDPHPAWAASAQSQQPMP